MLEAGAEAAAEVDAGDAAEVGADAEAGEPFEGVGTAEAPGAGVGESAARDEAAHEDAADAGAAALQPPRDEAHDETRDAAASGAAPLRRPPEPLPQPLIPPRPRVEWERWLGVRGAAVLGGAALALAGLFFFRYSIEHGLIPPWLRVVLGVVLGVGAVGAAESTLRARYAGTANALAGGGLVVLYAAFWASGMLYELVSPGVVFAAMALVTATACLLSWRHESLVIAVIGLVGGFLTPAFASTGEDRPFGLFGYLLLLDVGVLLLARRSRWPLLALLAIAGTTLYQVFWIAGSMGAARTLLGLAILAVFALLFVALVPREADGADARAARGWRLAQYGAVLLPLATALYFAAEAELATGILPLGGLLFVLGVAAVWLAVRHGEGLLALGAGAATLGVVFVWLAQNPLLGGTPWRAAVVLVALAAAYQLGLELARRERLGEGDAPADESQAAAGPAGEGAWVSRAVANAAALVGLGWLVLLIAIAADERVSLWPLLAAALGVALLLVRQATFPGRGGVQVAAAVGVALLLVAHRLGHRGDPDVPSAASGVVLPAMLAVAAAWQGLALAQPRLGSRRFAEHGAAALALVLLLGVTVDPSQSILVGLLVPLALGFLVLLAATRLGGCRWLVVAVAATGLAQTTRSGQGLSETSSALGPFALVFLSFVLFGVWPLAAAQRLRDDRWAWRAAALSGVVFFVPLYVLFGALQERLGDWLPIALLPLALAAVTVAVAARARNLWPSESDVRTSALAWLCGVALGFVTVAIPMQVEKSWITIGWALEGAALLVLWQRLDHPGLKYTALALLAAVTVRLVANPAVLDYYPRSGWPIVNWLAWTYLVPAAALVFAARTLHPLELPRLRDWERRWYPREQPLATSALGLAALLVVFVWINLAIADWFSGTGELRLLAAETPAENLVVSIAWTLYAIVLLVLGVRLASGALRWASLVLLMLTIGKIFLYDLSELRDLYRVAALLGLALSLIVVSLVYQRFVFRRSSEGEP
ncbi:MAG TPA: DUF2339 domain-containing protein [Candidatus Binatia bacterium]